MKILYIDMDGVVADFDKFMTILLPGVSMGEGVDYEVRSKMVDEAAAKYPKLFEEFEFIEGAHNAVNVLNDSGLFDILFLSTPMCAVPESYMGKRIWLRDRFGSWVDKRLVLTHRKDLCIGDYLVDDRLKNGVDGFKGEHIHFGSEKFPHWNNVLKYLLL